MFTRISERLGRKIMTCMLSMAVVPLVILSYMSYRRLYHFTEDQKGTFLKSVATESLDKIDRNLFERYGDVQAFAANPKALSPSPGDVTAVADFFTKLYVIYDFMVIADPDGTIIATNSVTHDGKPVDQSRFLGQSVKNEPWFRHVAGGKLKPGETYYTDPEIDPMTKAAIGGDGYVLNFSAPVYDESGKIVRVWSNRASVSRIISQIVEETKSSLDGQGSTGVELRLIDSKGLLLFTPGRDDLRGSDVVKTGIAAARRAVAKETSWEERADKERGVWIDGFAHSDGALGFAGYGWSILASQHSAQWAGGVWDDLTFKMEMVAVVLVLGMIVAARVSRSIVRPIESVRLVLNRLALGDLTPRVALSTRDEVGQMARELNEAMDGISRALNEVSAQADEVAESSRGLVDEGEVMVRESNYANGEAEHVFSAASRISESLGTLASAADQMRVTVKEIAKSTTEAAQMSGDGATIADQARECVKRLRQGSLQIERVLDVITTVAEQTNLLALNAAVESSRAGEAGRGFGVVAGEVKELARETTKAADNIRKMIEAIQKDTKEATLAVDELTSLMGRIREAQTLVASAIEEQSATTAEMSRSVSETAAETKQIAQNIEGVTQRTSATSEGARRTTSSAQAFMDTAERLRTVVSGFELTEGGEA